MKAQQCQQDIETRKGQPADNIGNQRCSPTEAFSVIQVFIILSSIILSSLLIRWDFF